MLLSRCLSFGSVGPSSGSGFYVLTLCLAFFSEGNSWAADAPPSSDQTAARAAYDRGAAELKALRDKEDLAGAREAAEKVYVAAEGVFGKGDWRTVDVRIAITEIEAAQKLTPEQRSKLQEAHGLMEEEAKLYSEGKLQEALPVAQQAAGIRLKILGEQSREYLESLLETAIIEQDLQKFDESEKHYRRVVELLEKTTGKNHPAYATALNELGTLLDWRNKFRDATAMLKTALEIRRATLGKHAFDYGRTLNNLGNNSRNLGNFRIAEAYYLEAIEVFGEQSQDPRNYVARCKNNLATCLKAQGRYREAEAILLDVLTAFRKAYGDKHPDNARILLNLGELYSTLGEFDKGEEHLRQAADLIKATLGIDHFLYGMVADSLAWLFKEEGNYMEAEKSALTALQIWRSLYGESSSQSANTLNSLGNIYRDQKIFDKAEEYLRQSLEVTGTVQGKTDPFYATILQNIALVNDDQGKFDAAETHYLNALNIYKDTGNDLTFGCALTTSNFGLLRFHQGRAAEAEQLYKQATETFNKTSGPQHPRAARTMRNLGDLKRAAKLPVDAESFYRTALDRQMKLVDAAALGQSERQQLAMASRFREYIDNYLSFAAENPASISPVYEYALRWKGAVFMRQRAQRALAARPDLAPLADALRQTTQELSHLALANPEPNKLEARRLRIAELTTQQEDLQRKLAMQSQAFREASEPFQVQSLLAALPDGAMLVDYWEYDHSEFPLLGHAGLPKIERRIAAFVLSKDQPIRLVAIGPAKPVREAVEVWRKDFGAGVASMKAGGNLRKQIWDPIEKLLHDAQYVLISPDGVMGSVPFGALPGKEPDTYLLQDWPISVVPVPQAIPILLQEQRQYPRGNLLLLGNINYDALRAPDATQTAAIDFGTRSAARFGGGATFAKIEDTKIEIEALETRYKKNWGDKGITVLEELAADEAAFRKFAPEHRYVHVATHGFFAPPELRSALGPQDSRGSGGGNGVQASGYSPGLLSGIALAGANHPTFDGDDGILTAEEAETLDLTKVDLVVLSACETGLGEVAGGEGVLGLQRAFQVAGARTVVASMWKVDDEETRKFMTRFYENMWGPERMKMLKAFREAQLWMMKEGPRTRDIRLGDPKAIEHKSALPFYWGAFVLSGDWR